MDPVELHRRGVQRSCVVVGGIGEDQWGLSTPCDEWDVRDLVNHLASEHRWALPLLDGATIEEVGEDLEGDLLGEDPIGSYLDAARAAQAKASGIDPEQTVHLSYGDVSAGHYLTEMATDMVVHSWDLAVATGQDATLDEDLAEELYRLTAPKVTDEVREMGVFGAEVEVPEHAPASERLLGLLGRDPAAGT